MNSRSNNKRSQLFTVRVWYEEAPGGAIEWRGRVECVMSGETLYFRDWDVMVAFIHDSSQPQTDDTRNPAAALERRGKGEEEIK